MREARSSEMTHRKRPAAVPTVGGASSARRPSADAHSSALAAEWRQADRKVGGMKDVDEGVDDATASCGANVGEYADGDVKAQALELKVSTERL